MYVLISYRWCTVALIPCTAPRRLAFKFPAWCFGEQAMLTIFFERLNARQGRVRRLKLDFA